MATQESIMEKLAAKNGTLSSKLSSLDLEHEQELKMLDDERLGQLKSEYVRKRLMQNKLPQKLTAQGAGTGRTVLALDELDEDYQSSRRGVLDDYEKRLEEITLKYQSERAAITAAMLEAKAQAQAQILELKAAKATAASKSTSSSKKSTEKKQQEEQEEEPDPSGTFALYPEGNNIRKKLGDVHSEYVHKFAVAKNGVKTSNVSGARTSNGSGAVR